MGLFSDLKNQFKREVETNEELKKSLEELQKTREQFEHVKKAATEKVSVMGSMTEEAARSFQKQATEASQKIKVSHYGSAKTVHTEDGDEQDKSTSATSTGGGAETKKAESGREVR